MRHIISGVCLVVVFLFFVGSGSAFGQDTQDIRCKSSQLYGVHHHWNGQEWVYKEGSPAECRGSMQGGQAGQPQYQEPADLPPQLNSFAEAVVHIGAQPITVSEVTPHDPYRQQQYGVFGGYGGYAGMRAASMMVGGYSGTYGGYGLPIGLYDSPVYSDIDPTQSLESLLQTEIQARLRRRGLNLLAPATGRGSVQLSALSAEAGVGKNAGVWGNHTWETARYTISASYAIADEDVSVTGFDGRPPGFAAQQISYQLDGKGGRTLRLIGDVMSLVTILKQRRKVQAVLFLDVLDIATRQILYSSQGIGELDERELKIVSIGGITHVKLRYANAQRLAEAMVVTALR